MRCLLLFFFCGVGRDPSWLLHVKRENCIFFPVDKPVSYPFHTCFILKKHKYIYTHSTLNMSFTHSRINASHVFNLYIYNSVRLLWLKSSARNHRNYLINELNWKSIFFIMHYYIQFFFLLHPFWNQWWSLQSYWFSAVWFTYEWHHFCSKSHLF